MKTFEHHALSYGSVEDFVDFTAPYVRSGQADGAMVFIAAGAEAMDGLRDTLGVQPEGSTLVDSDQWAPHPATRLRAFHDVVTNGLATGVTDFRLMGEPLWPHGPPEFRREWARYESVLNDVLAPFPVDLVCVYNAAELPDDIVSDSHRTHPDVIGSGASPHFTPPQDLLREWVGASDPPPQRAERITNPDELGSARRFVAEQAVKAGLDRNRSEDLAMAANELLTNSILYSDGAEYLATWAEGERAICQLEDRGGGIADPLAGYRPPPVGAVGGRGLWLARQLVDLLELVPTPTGTVARLHMMFEKIPGVGAARP